jgi:hypothetical protein
MFFFLKAKKNESWKEKQMEASLQKVDKRELK